jgi:hypothetical protein
MYNFVHARLGSCFFNLFICTLLMRLARIDAQIKSMRREGEGVHNWRRHIFAAQSLTNFVETFLSFLFAFSYSLFEGPFPPLYTLAQLWTLNSIFVTNKRNITPGQQLSPWKKDRKKAIHLFLFSYIKIRGIVCIFPPPPPNPKVNVCGGELTSRYSQTLPTSILTICDQCRGNISVWSQVPRGNKRRGRLPILVPWLFFKRNVNVTWRKKLFQAAQHISTPRRSVLNGPEVQTLLKIGGGGGIFCIVIYEEILWNFLCLYIIWRTFSRFFFVISADLLRIKRDSDPIRD